MAAVIVSSKSTTLFAPASFTAWVIALFCTCVNSLAIQTKTFGLKKFFPTDFFIALFIIASVALKSTIFPAITGLFATTFPGIRPNNFFAVSP